MRCHECGSPAAYAPESSGLKVGLCERHLRVYLDELSAARSLSDTALEEKTAD